MFKIHINDETNELPLDDICYIVAKEGVFLKKKLGIMESVAPVDKISTLKSISSYAIMHIKKIPGSSFAKVVDFFRKVYDQYSGEAVVLLFYQEDSEKYRIVPPHQKVSSASIDYNRGISLDGWNMIGTIHSHASMSAFHSGVDDDDEETFDGLHITIGNVNSKNFSISASIIANGYRAIVDPEEYISGIKKVSEIDRIGTHYLSKVYNWKGGELQLDEKASKKSLTNTQKYDKRYICLASPSKSICNPKWLSVVEKITLGWPSRRHSYGYGKHYDPHAWYKHGVLSRFTHRNLYPYSHNTQKLPIQVSNQIIIDNTSTINEDVDNDNNIVPCLTCRFRNQKLLMEENEEFSEELLFKCTKCEGVFTEEDLVEHNMKCPQCKTDEHFSVMDESELESNYQQLSEDELLGVQQPDQIGFHICESCRSSFLRLEGDTECPFCQTSLDISVKESGEVKLIEQSKLDSGAYLGDITDEMQEEILEQAAKTDEEIEKILVPNKNEIPLSKKTPSTLKSMFKKVFGKGY